MARSTIWIAQSTPAQNPRGAAINIRKRGRLMSLSVMDAAFRRLCPRTKAASFRLRASHGADKTPCSLHKAYNVSIQKDFIASIAVLSLAHSPQVGHNDVTDGLTQ